MNKSPQPPRLPLRFFRWFCHPDYVEDIEGDLLERFEKQVEEKGLRKAKWLFGIETLKLLRPGMIKSLGGTYRLNQYGLFLHYLKISFRGFTRDKAFASINVFGLAVGLAAALLLYQYIRFELSYDRFHPDAEKIYRITQTTLRNGEEHIKEAFTWSGLGEAARESLPGVEELVRVHPISNLSSLVVSNPENSHVFYEDDILYVDPGFFKLFHFPLLHGRKENALEDIHSILITENAAIKYFGKMDVVGKRLKVHGGSLSGDFTVKGVLENLPENSHLKFDMLIPMDFMLSHYGQYVRSDGWSWTNFSIYLKTQSSTNLPDLIKGLNHLVQERLGEQLQQANEEIRIELQPMADIHLRSDLTAGYGWSKGEIENIWIFGAVGGMILIIAWVNYINLATARAIRRSKEVGVKKSLGANTVQLTGQFLFESFLVHLLAVVIAIGLAVLGQPLLAQMAEKKLSLEAFGIWQFWLGLLIILIGGSFLSGLYPALILARFRPLSMLKSTNTISNDGHYLRKGLIFFQFLVSMLLVSGTYITYRQISFMKSQELGVEMDKILVLTGPRAVLAEGRDKLRIKHRLFKNELLKHHNIRAVSGTSNIPSEGLMWSGGMRRLGSAENENREGEAILVDSDFTKVYDLEFLAGGPFAEEMQDYEAVIINEEAVKVFGLKSPIDAVNESIVMHGVDTLRIHGVVKDFHWNSLRSQVKPVIFGIVSEFNAYLSLKVNTNNVGETLGYVENSFRKIYPNDPFECYFLDESFNRQYHSDVQFGRMFFAFSLIAIFIACIGLFALISFSAVLRVKEIGIRKVLGANLWSLMLLLSKEYLILLLLAITIAIPVIVIAGQNWLQNYAYRIGFSPDLLVIPAIALLAISSFTVVQKVFSVANTNPVESLRDE